MDGRLAWQPHHRRSTALGPGCTFPPYPSRPQLAPPNSTGRRQRRQSDSELHPHCPAANTAKPPAHTTPTFIYPAVACTCLPVIFRSTLHFARQTTSPQQTWCVTARPALASSRAHTPPWEINTAPARWPPSRRSANALLQADSLTEEQVSEFKEAFSLFVSDCLAHMPTTTVRG